jgi:hypothetical protein
MKQTVAILAVGLVGLGTGACGSSSEDSGSTSRTSPGVARATNPSQGGGQAAKAPQALSPKKANRGDSAQAGSGASESTARRYPHGDNSIQTFGREGGETDRQAVAELVKRYYAAVAADDGAKACSMMSSGLSGSLVSGLGRSPKAHGKGCGAILSLLFKGRGRQAAAGLLAPEVTGVRLRGARGFALLRSKAIPAGEISIVRERGVWKIAALIGSALP